MSNPLEFQGILYSSNFVCYRQNWTFSTGTPVINSCLEFATIGVKLAAVIDCAGFIKSSPHGPRHRKLRFVPLLLSVAVTSLASCQTDTDKSIKEKLAAPPAFLDEQHQGPTLVRRDLPGHILPFDCAATEAYVHRVR